MVRFRQLKMGLLVFAFALFIFLFQPLSAEASPRVLIETDNYQLSKFEPKDGAYLGAYVYQDTLIKGDMNTFNQLTGKKHASFFYYVGYGRPAPTDWLQEVKKANAFPHIAWEPNDGLDVIQDDEYLRSFARDLAAFEGPVFLRFASEMNGAWTAYHGNPSKYIEKWRLVHKVMKEEAPNVIMLWTVFTFPQRTIEAYYPGDEYVDWVGVNIYNVVYHNNNLREPAAHEDPLELLDYVYSLYGNRKPIQISEYGATHYTITDNKEYVNFAVQKISRLYGNLQEKYPRVKSIYYFNVNNLVNAPEGRQINNYALTDNEKILSTYSRLIGSPYFLSEPVANEQGECNKEYMLPTKPTYNRFGSIYLAAEDLEKYLNLKITFTDNNKSLEIEQIGSDKEPLKLNPVYYGTPKKLYLPLRAVAEHFGYTVNYNGEEQLIKVTKYF